MASRHRPAKQVAEPTEGNGFWIDHAQVTDDDLVWLEQVEELTLWNVKLPSGFLARLPRLWWLDIRGGTAVNLESLRGAAHLQYLAVNRVGGLRDLSEIALLTSLRLLSLYGLAQVSTLPSLRGLAALERAEIGQMRSLGSLEAILDAPCLQEVYLHKRVPVTPSDLDRIAAHPTLRAFYWNAEDVPDNVWLPVVEQVKLPPAHALFAGEWFDLHGRKTSE